jgi:hypothetical protein
VVPRQRLPSGQPIPRRPLLPRAGRKSLAARLQRRRRRPLPPLAGRKSLAATLRRRPLRPPAAGHRSSAARLYLLPRCPRQVATGHRFSEGRRPRRRRLPHRQPATGHRFLEARPSQLLRLPPRLVPAEPRYSAQPAPVPLRSTRSHQSRRAQPRRRTPEARPTHRGRLLLLIRRQQLPRGRRRFLAQRQALLCARALQTPRPRTPERPPARRRAGSALDEPRSLVRRPLLHESPLPKRSLTPAPERCISEGRPRCPASGREVSCFRRKGPVPLRRPSLA